MYEKICNVNEYMLFICKKCVLYVCVYIYIYI